MTRSDARKRRADALLRVHEATVSGLLDRGYAVTWCQGRPTMIYDADRAVGYIAEDGAAVFTGLA